MQMLLRTLSNPIRVLTLIGACVLITSIALQTPVDAFKLGEYAKSVKKPDATAQQTFAKKSTFNDFSSKKKVLKRELFDDEEAEYDGEQVSEEDVASLENGGNESLEENEEESFVFKKVRKEHHVIQKRELTPSAEAESVEEVEEDETFSSENKKRTSFFDALKFWKTESSEEQEEVAEEEAFCTEKAEKGFPLFQWLKDYIKNQKSEGVAEDSPAPVPKPETTSESTPSFLSSVMDTVKVFQSTVSKAATVVSETASENLKFSLFDESYEPATPKSVITYEEFQKLLLQLPSFVPNYTNIFNIDCKRQGQIFERQLRAHKTWTLQLMDANAKLPSGILRGNINQLGDYDQCLGIATKIKVTEDQSIRFRGKYCLAHIEIQAKDEVLRGPVHLMHGKGSLRSNFRDPNHFLPRFTTANWGLCVPSSCSTTDAELILQKFLKPYNTTLGIKLIVEINEGNCVVKASNKGWMNFFTKNWKTTTTLCVFGFITFFTLLATLDDFWALSNLNTIFMKKATTEDENTDKPEDESQPDVVTPATVTEEPSTPGLVKKIFTAFSLKQNVKMLIQVNTNPDSTATNFSCVHGVRALATIFLFISLKFIPLGKIPYSNRFAMTEIFNWSVSILLRAVFLYMETFLVVNGLLAGYGMSKEFKERGKINVARRLIGRVLRLAPTLGATLLFYSLIWEHVGEGPQWNDVVIANANLCKKNWWQNMFFIQNWFPVEKMCATHTFQLSIELQMYALLPLLIWLLYKHPEKGLAVVCSIIGLSTAARYSSVVDNRLSLLIFHGMKLSQIYRTINFSYASLLHRITPYLVGAGIGVLIQEEEGKDKEKIVTKLSKGFIQIGWISSFYCLFWLFWTQTGLANKNYQYDPTEAAQYGAMAPLLWSLSICWIVYACSNGCGKLINSFLSSKPMIVISRLSYAIFLIQFLIFFYTVGVTRDTETFKLSALLNRMEIIYLIVGALALTLFIDIPMQNLKRIVFPVMDGSSTTESAAESTAPADDFKSPFDDRNEDDDFVTRSAFKSRQASAETFDSSLLKPSPNGRDETITGGKDDSETESADHFWDRRHNEEDNEVIENIRDAVDDEEEEEDSVEEEEEEEEELVKPKVTRYRAQEASTGGPQKIKWRWDLHED